MFVFKKFLNTSRWGIIRWGYRTDLKNTLHRVSEILFFSPEILDVRGCNDGMKMYWACWLFISAYLGHFHNFLDIMPGVVNNANWPYIFISYRLPPLEISLIIVILWYTHSLTSIPAVKRPGPGSGELWSLMVWNKYVFIRCIISASGLWVVFITLNSIKPYFCGLDCLQWVLLSIYRVFQGFGTKEWGC